MLLAASVPSTTLDTHLRTVSGSISNPEAVLAVLAPDNKPVRTIVCGIGGPPQLTGEVTVCQDAARAILNGLESLKAKSNTAMPFLVTISTTGITAGKRDVPLAFAPLYHVGLRVPHKDKEAMESIIVEAGQKPEAERVLQGWCLVRPSLLMDGQGKELGNVRVGTEEKPAVGYTINRADVGRWIFEECVKGQPEKWSGKKVTLTY